MNTTIEMEQFINDLEKAVKEIDFFKEGVTYVSSIFYILVDLPYTPEGEVYPKVYEILMPLAEKFALFTPDQEIIFAEELGQAIKDGRFKRVD